LGKDGLKMSKSKGNVVNPGEIMQELGVDAIRWYFYTATHPWVPRLFYKEIVLKTLQKFMGTLKNVYSFFVLYANIDGFVPAQHAIKAHALLPVDGWVLSRLNSLAGEVKTCLDAYDIYKAARLIEDFVVEDLSTWYVRLNRARFWGKRLDENKLSAFVTLYEVLFKLSRLIAPFAPFLAEEMYQNLAGADIKDKKMPESVHLCDYPLSESGYVNKNLEAEMDTVRNIVFLGRTARETADIKVRQPLAEIIVCGIKAEMQSRLAPLEYLILDELNIKKLGFNAAIETLPADRYAIEKNNQLSVAVDKKLTPELESEGLSRELVSKIQHLRKQSGFKVTDHILLAISSQPEVVAAFNTYQEYICRETLAVAVETLEENSANVRQKVKINGRETEIFLCKAG
jgi:isoleucyl-tRNA synthetase